MSAAIRFPAVAEIPQFVVSALQQRPTLTSRALVIRVALMLALVHNLTFWKVVAYALPTNSGWHWAPMVFALFITLVSLLILAMLLFSNRYTLKPALLVFIMTAAICSYFMNSFGTVIDTEMLVNAMQTDRREASELIGLPLIGYVLLLGVLPCWYVTRVRVTRMSIGRETLRTVLMGLAALGLTAATILSNYKDLSIWTRESRQIRLYVNPTFPLYSIGRYASSFFTPPKGELVPIATDATRVVSASSKPLNVILVVGETARAENFGLNGYRRDTTPSLRKIDGIINFSNVSSCGTSTAESLPCMFSRLGKRHFSRSNAESQQNLLDVLQRVGVSVLWRENNSGCKGVCARVPSQEFKDVQSGKPCTAVGCPDGILLDGFAQTLATKPGQAKLVVMHQLGSHGPSYYKRYPAEFRRYTPDCAVDEVQNCSHEEIVNAYDNTILYTDFLLSQMIQTLKDQQDSADSVLLYVSDHGESLGEHGIYLHGLPYAIAPDSQTHIPMVAWFSEGARKRLSPSGSCLQSSREQSISHDNLFDTLLGLFSVRSADYLPEQDLFRTCT